MFIESKTSSTTYDPILCSEPKTYNVTLILISQKMNELMSQFF